jgi:hypothetical protein
VVDEPNQQILQVTDDLTDPNKVLDPRGTEDHALHDQALIWLQQFGGDCEGDLAAADQRSTPRAEN